MNERIGSVAKKLRSLSGDERIVASAAAAVILPDLYIVPVCLVWAALILFDRRRLALVRRSPAAPVLIPLLFVMTVPAMISKYPYGAGAGLAGWTILLFGIFASEILSATSASFVMDALLVSSASAAVYGVICKRLGILEIGRVASFFENPNHYAYVIELFVLIAVCRYACTRKNIYLAAAAVNILMNLLCGCRTAWLAILAGVTVFAMLTLRRPWLPAASAVTGGVMAFCLRLLPETGDRLSAQSVSHSLDNRVRYWENALRWFRQRPLIGWGVTSYSFLSASEGERVLSHAHNMILNLLLDTGVIGLIFFSVFMVLFLRPVFKRYPKENGSLPYRSLAAAAMTATVIHGITDCTLLGISPSIIFMLVISFSGRLRRDDPDTRI